MRSWLKERIWTIAWTSVLLSAAWLLGPVACVVHKSSGRISWYDYRAWALASCEYQYLFPIALIPLGLAAGWWIWPKISARREFEVQRLKQEYYRQKTNIADQYYQLERKRVDIDTHCQVELNKANKIIQEARAKIDAREVDEKAHQEMLHKEIEEQRQAINEKEKKLKLCEEKIDTKENDLKDRQVMLDKLQADLEGLKSELTMMEQRLNDWDQHLDDRERALIKKEQPFEIPEEATGIMGQPHKYGRVGDDRAIEDDLPGDEISGQVIALEEKIWKTLWGHQPMTKRDLERKLNKSRYANYWGMAISNLLTSGKVIHDADSNSYRCQQEYSQ